MGSYSSLSGEKGEEGGRAGEQKLRTTDVSLCVSTHVASFPPYLRRIELPPGWFGANSVKSYTFPCTMSQRSSFLLCLATSAPLSCFAIAEAGGGVCGGRLEVGGGGVASKRRV